ncbi:hypothetical protein PGTUg99_030608 [Puccinia graminis f. sp. tritici]|uniref:Uncharacterized protein n=1 Tax=Puccinia graminis f. sp. tritici TaxID=56615 RepID=A0A5B0P486_PUCGR|nr:hypothetical protein PGTUg99_030608 [Puccinia graminis f. sp. tritici]
MSRDLRRRATSSDSEGLVLMIVDLLSKTVLAVFLKAAKTCGGQDEEVGLDEFLDSC